jgi:Na+/H+-dicarboxylate symporter
MLKALILPLIVPSLITAVGSLDMSLSGKVGGRAMSYYMGTTILAVILGIILVTSIHPGTQAKNKNDLRENVESRNVTTPDTLMDLVRNLVPPNLLQATMQQYRTSLKYPGNAIKNESGVLRDPKDPNSWAISGHDVHTVLLA